MKAKLLFLVFLLGVSLQSLAQINITTQPVASVTKCEGGTLTLSVEATGIGLTYQWYHNGYAIMLATNPIYTHSPVTIAEAGPYNCLINGFNSPAVMSNVAQVTLNPAPTIASIAPISACDSYTLPPYNDSMFVNTGAPMTHYYRMPGGPTVPGNIELFPGSIITASQTIYPFCQLGNSCFDDTPMQITLSQTPVIAPISQYMACGSYTLPPYSSILSTVPVTHYYTTASAPFTDSQPIITAPGATVYAYAETGTTPNCWTTSPFVFTVYNVPVIAPIASITACDTYTLPSLNITNAYANYFTSSNGPFGTGTIISSGTIITNTTLLYVHAINIEQPMCNNEVSFTVTIFQTPTIAPIAPVTVCDAYTLPPYSSIVTTNGGVSHYYTEPIGTIEKYPGDVISSTTTLYAFANSWTTPSCWSNAPWQININQAPNIITPLLLPVYNVMLGQSLSISVVATGANLTYQWYHGGTPIAFVNNPSALTATLTIAPATLMDNGIYTCQVTNLDGCGQVTTSTQVIVNPLSVVENSKVDFSVYPNPASNMVTVQYSNASNTTATIAVYNLQGKQVLQQETTIENNQSRVSIASLQSGLYLIKITTADASVTKKLMVN